MSKTMPTSSPSTVPPAPGTVPATTGGAAVSPPPHIHARMLGPRDHHLPDRVSTSASPIMSTPTTVATSNDGTPKKADADPNTSSLFSSSSTTSSTTSSSSSAAAAAAAAAAFPPFSGERNTASTSISLTPATSSISDAGHSHNANDDDNKKVKSARPRGSVGVTNSDDDDDLTSLKLDRSIVESTDELSSSSSRKTDLQLSSSAQQQQQQSARARAFCVEDDDRLNLTQLMVCGGLAGITEHVAMFPVDTIKTRMQSYTAIRDVPASWTMAQTTRDVVRREGIWSLWRGMSAVLLSAGPAHAVYFATYERVTTYLGGLSWFSGGKQQTAENNEDNNKSVTNEVHVNPLVTSIAGGCATIVGDGLMTPLDVVKQRMQLRSTAVGAATTTNTSNVWNCISHVYRNHGARAFYAGYKATLLMNIPFTAVYFTGYETAKQMLLRYQRVEDDEFSVSSHCLAGAAAGAAAAAITNPLDVVKTRLQTQGEVGARRYRGLVDALYSIRVEEGSQGLLRGMRARVLFHMPAAAVCWTTYEFCKHVMKRTGWWSGDDDDDV